MKREDKMDDYIAATLACNLHPELEGISGKYHRIFYGPSGSGKYTQALRMIYPHSPSQLKYEKKMQLLHNNQSYWFKFSDVHYELDMELIGCNDKSTWHELFTQIYDIVYTKPSRHGFIVCHHFHTISSELLDIFYSYMQPLDKVSFTFYLLTESVSFLPSSIRDRCQLIPVIRPSHTFEACFKRPIPTILTNLKDAMHGRSHDYTVACNTVLEHIRHGTTYMSMREDIYQLFILDVPVEYFIEYIVCSLLLLLPKEEWGSLFKVVLQFYKRYQHHYRPLYHLEYFIYSSIKILHGYSNCT